MRTWSSLQFISVALACYLCASTLSRADELPPPAARTIDFVKDVQPIFAAACLKCHGPTLQEGEYRLDVREIALTKGASYAPNIIPKKSSDSPLIQFVAGQVDGMQMPAKGPKLTAEQIGILRAWIDQGAIWPDSATIKVADKLAWWSLQPLRAVAVPIAANDSHPIDAFIRAKLAKQKLHPSPRAERRVLIRRLYFDLIGLPPSPAEIDAFVANRNPDAYEQLVDQLLASPQFGERWARHWLDTAHFAETHGHDQDRIRENAWPYRDYLIAAFNRDKPYSQFVREQIAGDALYPHDPQATVALGFLAAGPWDESSLRDIREDTDRQIARYLDRDDMLASALNNFASLTVQCARCHDHKFDPIPQVDYYALQAVFAGVERANRTFDADPAVAQQRLALQLKQQQLLKLDEATKAELLSDVVQTKVAAWEREQGEQPAAWQVLSLFTLSTSDGSVLTKQGDGSFLAAGSRPEKETYTFAGVSPLREVTALRLEVLTHNSLPHQGPGRQDNGNLHLSEIEVFIGDNKTAIPIARAVADFDQDGWGVARAIDGNAATAWGIYPQVGKSHEAVFEFKEPLRLAPEQSLTISLKQLHGGGHLIGRPRLSITAAKNPLKLNPLPAEIAAIISVPREQRTAEQRLAVALHQQREQVSRELDKLPKPSLIYAAASDFTPDGNLRPPPGPRPIHLLHRGEITQPRAEVLPGGLSCLTAIPAKFDLRGVTHESARRAALAEWLTHRDNPLTWRSIVNRIWQQHFGRGIVSTPNDFGRMGSLPTHPELLDWLAIRYRDSDQSLKSLHRLIVTSETYQQTSQAALAIEGGAIKHRTDLAATRDADNQWLWRMQRSRLDAECIRDAVLTVSARIDHRMGGPSDRQFDLKPGRHVTPIIDYAQFDLDGPKGSRRSIYRFLFRTLPDPFMEALDCPAGDQIMPTRTNSVTVQQSLALWNDAFVLRQAEHFAARLTRETTSKTACVSRAFQLTLGRSPTASERERFTHYVEQHGLANFCRLLFNANEFVFIE